MAVYRCTGQSRGWLFQVARTFGMDPLASLIEDDELRMVFLCCHPAIPRDARVALSLKTVGGFGVAEIARAFLVAEATVSQRLVRAKRTLRDARTVDDFEYGRREIQVGSSTDDAPSAAICRGRYN